MGMHWGSEYIAVTAEDLEQSRVVMVSRYPTALGNGDQTAAVVPDGLENYRRYPSEKEAINAVKHHIFEETLGEILELTYRMELMKMHNQKLRFEKEAGYKHSIECNKAGIDRDAAKLKKLKKLRTSPVSVSYS